MIEWLNKNWLSITVPAIVFLAFAVVAVWARKALYLKRQLNHSVFIHGCI